MLDEKRFAAKQINIATGIYQQEAVFLKLYKKSWASTLQDPLTAESRIFFSVWVTDGAIQQQQLLYNIHALKLRKLQGYTIESRKFADTFRNSFKPFETAWPNVSVQFGPLTLMQGSVKTGQDNFQDKIIQLSNNFLTIAHLIDDALIKFKKQTSFV